MRVLMKRPRLVSAIACAIWLASQASLFANEVAPVLKVELSAEHKELDTIAAWASQTNGRHTLILRGDVAKLLGLTTGKDINGTGVSFSNPAGARISFGLYSRPPEIVMTESNSERTYYWLIKDGILAKTVYLTPNSVQPVPNDRYLDNYTNLRKFFVRNATGTNANP